MKMSDWWSDQELWRREREPQLPKWLKRPEVIGDRSIYIIGQVNDEGPVKIGISRRPKSRLSTIQTGYPNKLKIILTFPGDDRHEAALHDAFRYQRVSGEWFERNEKFERFLAKWHDGDVWLKLQFYPEAEQRARQRVENDKWRR